LLMKKANSQPGRPGDKRAEIRRGSRKKRARSVEASSRAVDGRFESEVGGADTESRDQERANKIEHARKIMESGGYSQPDVLEKIVQRLIDTLKEG